MKRPDLTGVENDVISYIEHLEDRVDIDALTGCHNRIPFLNSMGREIDGCLRNGKKFSGAIVDVDEFKIVNDNHGHAKGDKVLANVGGNARKMKRFSDFVGRYSGDEFVFSLRGTDEKTAKNVIDRFRIYQDNNPICAGGEVIKVTISGGVADLYSTPEIHLLRGEHGRRVMDSFYNHGINDDKTENQIQKFIDALILGAKSGEKTRFEKNYSMEVIKYAMNELSDNADTLLVDQKIAGDLMDYIGEDEFKWQLAAYLVINRADKALYNSKQNGKNHITTYREFNPGLIPVKY